MKKIIYYYEIKSNHIFATPQFDRSERMEVSSEQILQDYINTKTDLYGNKYKINKDFGDNHVTSKFTHISNQGALIVQDYVPPEFKKIG